MRKYEVKTLTKEHSKVENILNSDYCRVIDSFGYQYISCMDINTEKDRDDDQAFKAIKLPEYCAYWANGWDTRFWYDKGEYKPEAKKDLNISQEGIILWYDHGKVTVLGNDGLQYAGYFEDPLEVIDKRNELYVHGVDVEKTLKNGYLCFTALEEYRGNVNNLELDSHNAYGKSYEDLFAQYRRRIADEEKELDLTVTLLSGLRFEKVMLNRNDIESVHKGSDFYTTVISGDNNQYAVLKEDLQEDCKDSVIPAIKLLSRCGYWYIPVTDHTLLMSGPPLRCDLLTLFKSDDAVVWLQDDGTQEFRVYGKGVITKDSESGISGINTKESLKRGYLVFTELPIQEKSQKSSSSALDMLDNMFGSGSSASSSTIKDIEPKKLKNDFRLLSLLASMYTIYCNEGYLLEQTVYRQLDDVLNNMSIIELASDFRDTLSRGRFNYEAFVSLDEFVTKYNLVNTHIGLFLELEDSSEQFYIGLMGEFMRCHNIGALFKELYIWLK